MGVWIVLAALGTVLQTARNAMQRGLVEEAGAWGATLVRFLFGLPFTILFLAAALALTGVDLAAGNLARNGPFWFAATLGGFFQVIATASLLAAMRAASFAIGSALQHTALPLAAVFGALALGDHLAPQAQIGIVISTFGIAAVSWPAAPKGDAPPGKPLVGATFGVLTGACFAVSSNAYRGAILALELDQPVVAGLVALTVAQAIQTVGLGLVLLVLDRRALAAIRRSVPASTLAGLFGAASSAFTFVAFALVPAALVRAVNVMVEAPIAVAVGQQRFREALPLRAIAGIALVVLGVALAALSPAG
jgi:drug/metabolite transporter (DMT)-like permease